MGQIAMSQNYSLDGVIQSPGPTDVPFKYRGWAVDFNEGREGARLDMPRSSRIQAARNRESIVDEVVADASVVGLEGITLGSLAERLGMSKAGVLGPFGSKEDLQLAALERAGETFRLEVWEKASFAEPGRDRLEAIIEAWLAYLAGDAFPGGCFLTQAAAEWDGRSGRVREAVVSLSATWLGALEREAAIAIDDGTVAKESDPRQIAFELNSIAQGVNQAIQLRSETDAVDRGRAAMLRVLGPSDA